MTAIQRFSFLKRYGRDRRGVAAVEFAFIAPVMILFYFGLAEYTQAIIAERKTSTTASAIGDLIAQADGAITATGSGGIDDIFSMKGVLMNPFPTGSAFKLCVVSIVANASNAKKVEWRRASNDSSCPAVNSPITSVPSALISANESVIMSRVIYTYTSPTNMVLHVSPTYTKTFYLRPRRSTKITCSTC